MKTLITGHRLEKLRNYDHQRIKELLEDVVRNSIGTNTQITYGLSGMASGVDLWYCNILNKYSIPYSSCIPFETQGLYMDEQSRQERKILIDKASKVLYIRNSKMLEIADSAIVIWDGNKGGTHNVFQQVLEQQKPCTWIEPRSGKVIMI